MDHQRQPALDVVRGIAILMVLLSHLHFATGIEPIDDVIRPVIEVGWAGVDLFFVLSGFLVGRLILAGCASADGFDRADFLKRRILRLWPVLFLYLGALVVAGGAKGVTMAVPVLLHIQNYSDVVPSHLWSLAIEEHFYLLAAVILPILSARRGPRGIAIMLVLVMFGSTTLRLLAWYRDVNPQILQWQTQYRADAVALGVTIAWIERYLPKWFAALLRDRARNVAVAIAGYATLIALETQARRFGPGLIAADLGSAALILAFHGAAMPLRPSGWLAALGGIAYPLYIWHASISQVAGQLAQGLGIVLPLGVFAIGFGMSVLVAALIAAMVERPFMRLRDQSSYGAGAWRAVLARF